MATHHIQFVPAMIPKRAQNKTIKHFYGFRVFFRQCCGYKSELTKETENMYMWTDLVVNIKIRTSEIL